MDVEYLECDLEVIELDAPDTDILAGDETAAGEIYLSWFTDWQSRCAAARPVEA